MWFSGTTYVRMPWFPFPLYFIRANSVSHLQVLHLSIFPSQRERLPVHTLRPRNSPTTLCDHFTSKTFNGTPWTSGEPPWAVCKPILIKVILAPGKTGKPVRTGREPLHDAFWDSEPICYCTFFFSYLPTYGAPLVAPPCTACLPQPKLTTCVNLRTFRGTGKPVVGNKLILF